MPRARTITLAEFEGVYAGDEASPPLRDGLHPLAPDSFKRLEELALAQSCPPDAGGNVPADPPLSLLLRKGVGKVVTVRNHVGVIALSGGCRIEVLPKTLRKAGTAADRSTQEESQRRLLLNMLRSAWDLDAREAAPTELLHARMPVFEAFVRMFLDLVAGLVKRGLPGGYTRIEGNERFFKGKLLVAAQVRENLVRKERFFVAHDEFRLDNPANRLLRSGLEWCLRESCHDANRRTARQLLTAFEDIPSSNDVAGDFASCAEAERQVHCRKALDWCRVFLRGNSIANLPGTRHAQALLFPMEKVFERHVARWLRRTALPGVEISTQEKRLCLFEESPIGPTFRLNPDIVVRRGKDVLAIADTKWKLLSCDPSRNFGMSQSDMYQMYAYQKRYKTARALLVYPVHDALGPLATVPPVFHTPADAEVRVLFWNPANAQSTASSAARLFTAATTPSP